MCMKPKPGEKIVPVRCRPVSYPCPTCGRRGHRKRRLERYVRSIAYGAVLWLRVLYAEYTARCDCRKTFRSCPPDICPRADYDNLVRQAVLNRILDDRLNAQSTRQCMSRDFNLELSIGFIYECLDWGLTQLNESQQRRVAREQFSGYLNIDELHLGDYTLLLATDPISDRVVGHRLVKVNDQAHMRCFVRALQYWGFEPKVVVTDGSNLYPAVLKEVWPAAKHQLCIFHVLQDVTNKVLDGVRRLRRQQARRGNGGRKRRRGRQSEAQKKRAQRRGPTNKEKASFVYKHRFLIVKRHEKLPKTGWKSLVAQATLKLAALAGSCSGWRPGSREALPGKFAEPADPNADAGSDPANAHCETCSALSRRTAASGWCVPHGCWSARASLPHTPGTPPSCRTFRLPADSLP